MHKKHTVFSMLSMLSLRKRGRRRWTSEHEARSNAPDVDEIDDDVVAGLRVDLFCSSPQLV